MWGILWCEEASRASQRKRRTPGLRTSHVLVLGEVPDALARAVPLRRLGAVRTVRRGTSPTVASQPAAEPAGNCCMPAAAVTLI